MEYKAHTYPYSLYLRHHLVLLQLLFLLVLCIGTVNSNINVPGIFKNAPAPTSATTKEDQSQQSEKESKQCLAVSQYTAECNCPTTLEPQDFKQLKDKLKDKLAPVIHHRLRELSVEFANEAAHTIDLLKLLDESNSELNMIRDKVHDGAQQLRAAFEKIPEHM